MTEVIGSLLLLLGGILIGCAMGFPIGLYLGEKGRREAAEQYLVHGTPSAPRARVVAPALDPEARVAEIGVAPETLETGARQIHELAKQAGRPISMAEARKQATEMVGLYYDPDSSTIPTPPL